MNTKTITIEGTVFFDTDSTKYQWCKPYNFFVGADQEAFSTYLPITNHTFTVEIPADFDPRPEHIKALEAKRKELQAQFAAAVTEINRQISQLQAIEYTEAA